MGPQGVLFNFNSLYFEQPKYHKLSNCLRGLFNMYAYDNPVPGPHIGSGKQQRRIPFPGWTEAIDVMYTGEQLYRVTTHLINMTNV